MKTYEDDRTSFSPDAAQFDPRGSIDSAWNKAVYRGVLEKLVELKEEWPCDISDDLVLEFIEGRFATLRSAWRKGVPCAKNNGTLETPREVEVRLVAGQEITTKMNQQRKRRFDVSTMSVVAN